VFENKQKHFLKNSPQLLGDQNKLDRQKLTDNVEKQDPKGLPSFF